MCGRYQRHLTRFSSHSLYSHTAELFFIASIRWCAKVKICWNQAAIQQEGGVGVRCWCWADCVYLRISAPLHLTLPLDGCESHFDVRSYIEGFVWFQKRRKKTNMTDSTTSDPCPVPNPTIVDPSAVLNGQCTAAQDPKRGSQGDPFNVDQDQEMKITDSVEGQGKHTSCLQHSLLTTSSYCLLFWICFRNAFKTQWDSLK